MCRYAGGRLVDVRAGVRTDLWWTCVRVCGRADSARRPSTRAHGLHACAPTNISEHADGKCRQLRADLKVARDGSHRDLSDATLRSDLAPSAFAVSVRGKLAKNKTKHMGSQALGHVQNMVAETHPPPPGHIASVATLPRSPCRIDGRIHNGGRIAPVARIYPPPSASAAATPTGATWLYIGSISASPTA